MKQFPVIEETEEVEVAPKEAAKPMGGGIRIPIPSGFKLPQGKREGDEIEAIVKLRNMGDHLMLDQLNGIALSDASEEEAEVAEEEVIPEEDGEEAFANELAGAVRQMS